MSKFTVNFDNRQITIRWQNPFFAWDGKAYSALLALLAAYCYLCNLTEDECQSTSKVMKGMPITRTVKKLRAHYFKMKKIAEKSKKEEKFIDKSSHKERQGLCGTPIVLNDQVCNPLTNLPTLHLYPHIFSLIKDLAYQLNSRLRTSTGLALAQEKVKKIKMNFKKERKECKRCKKRYINLFCHVSSVEQCKLFYKQIREFERLKVSTENKRNFRQKNKPKIVNQKIHEDTKSRFTADVKLHLHIAINQVKTAGILFMLQYLKFYILSVF